MYEINFSNNSIKFISKLDPKKKRQIKEVIDKLKINPFYFPYKKLNKTDYRIRVGSFRISYCIYKNKLLIEIIKIGKRENFYE